jgi:hypothetical protein
VIRLVIRFYQRILNPMIEIRRRSGRRLPLFAVLFELFHAGRRGPRAVPRVVVWNLPDFPLSSMGGQWL